MKAKLIKRAALAAAILAGGGVAYGENVSNAVVYCTAIITEGADSGNTVVSVSLPPTEGYYDNRGNPVTVWNVGKVPAGGVADSWHGEGGPGRFTARNTGNVRAYFYVTTQRVNGGYIPLPTENGFVSPYPHVMGDQDIQNYLGLDGISGGRPCISPQELRGIPDPGAYHLAFTTDTMAKVPTWHSLDHMYNNGHFSTDGTYGNEVAGFMGCVDAGDYLTFDLKYWASSHNMGGNYPVLFTFCVEASSFPLWDHGRAVE